MVVGDLAQRIQVFQVCKVRQILEGKDGTADFRIDEVQPQFIVKANAGCLVMVDDNVRLIYRVYQLYHVVIWTEVREDDCFIRQTGNCFACRIVFSRAAIVRLDGNYIWKYILEMDMVDRRFLNSPL